MATWEVITGKLALEAERSRLEAEQRDAAADLRAKVDLVLGAVSAAAGSARTGPSASLAPRSMRGWISWPPSPNT